ncbi:uncharacterized protein LMH87_008760 [Akanthomyces muscarius]|uniref:Uncharacterized protein n=1 Tax=Akanthomyces muscarius TaxID=2231603 RepID=A0A9W8UQ34_AKAMU|nr:uncharacterized protein LMH87_008760 [Akanthomyces muscarius]KAJ4158227.1 hypothetical protein LMH87_008760 [Akanthomyces muscarius]
MSLRGTFDTRFQTEESDHTYFLHHVDEDAKTLCVQVLGYGISNIFLHQQSATDNRKQMTLAKKTSGFLAAVTASRKRIVLAWAESGHGIGRHGDRLKASGHVLGNTKWASMAIKLAKILDLDLASPFDKPTTPPGSFQAAHVEVKLAAHAAMLLLQQSRAHITERSSSALTRANLAQLRHLQWSNGSPIHFEGTRVVPIRYHQQQLKAAAKLGLGRSPGAESRKRKHKTTTTTTTVTTTKLQTYEENGVIHYMPPQRPDEESGASQASAPFRIPIPVRVSPHHLSDVDKPLPATPVTEAPDVSSQEADAENMLAEPVDNLPFPPRSPRPYGMSLS